LLLDDICRTLQADFAKKVRTALEGLETWSERELYYRRWYELRHDEKALTAFFNTLDPHFRRKKHLITPEFLEQNKDGLFLQEAMFHTSDTIGKNVFLRKHHRYMPEFYHKHDFFEIVFVLHGQCTDTIAGERISFPTGSLYFIAPETYHSIEMLEDSLVIYILVKRSTFEDVFINLLNPSDVISKFFMRNIYSKNVGYLAFNISNDTELLRLFLDMLVEQSVSDKTSSRIMEMQFSILLSMLHRKYRNSPLVYEQVCIKSEYWEIIAHIHKNFRTLTHAKLAAQFDLSVAHCSRIIKSITGKNFTTLVNNLRMN